MNELKTLNQARPETQRRFMTGVYLRMVFALAITTAVAYFTANQIATNPQVQHFYISNFRACMWGCAIAEIGLVFIISAAIRKLSPAVAMLLFILYSIVTGLTFSSILFVFEIHSIFKVFAVSALMFVGMTIYGMFTKSDLRSAGRYLMMALIGVIIASLLNFLFKSSTLDWILSLVGIGIFVGLTAYDTQKLMNIAIYDDGSENFQKYAILGALELYLDFINIFLKMLSLFGKKK